MAVVAESLTGQWRDNRTPVDKIRCLIISIYSKGLNRPMF